MATLVWMLVAVAAPAASDQTAPADDVPALVDVVGGVHKPAIDSLHRLGLFEGTLCGEEQFCPDQPINRWVMAVWLIRALDAQELQPPVRDVFEDVDDNRWWAPYVGKLAELEVTRGCDTDPPRFCPDRSVTRAEMAAFLVRAFELPPSDDRMFVDTDRSGHHDDINALASANITTGCLREPARYCPDQSVTRAQMATFLSRALAPPVTTDPVVDPAEGTPSPPADPPEDSASDGYIEADILAAEAQMADLLNGLRRGLGVTELSYYQEVAEVARRWSQTMASTGDFKHNPSYYLQYPPGWRSAGENVSYVSSARRTLDEKVQWAFAGLVESPGHYRNMVNPFFTHLGVGIAVNGDTVYVTQNFANYPPASPTTSRPAFYLHTCCRHR